MAELQKGLEGVVAVETRICYIDGEKGILKYRGYDINELVNYSYAAVSCLLMKNELMKEEELTGYTDQLKGMREVEAHISEVLGVCNFNIEALGALRTAVSYMAHCDPDLNDNSYDANVRKAMRLIASFPTIVTSFHSIRTGTKPVPPSSELSHGANLLYMLRGEEPKPLEAEIMEKDLILSAEHELNASTFAARIAISTLSDYHSGIICGLSTLNGPLHGGARMEVMNMLEKIATPDAAEEFVIGLISDKKRIMGFGHRVYKTHDPRGLIYKKLVAKIAEASGDSTYYDIAQNIENTVNRELVEKKGKPIYPNVDFYSAVAYQYLKIPPPLATSIFAIGRISGWSAHIIEQFADNRLIRPRAKYIGDIQG